MTSIPNARAIRASCVPTLPSPSTQNLAKTANRGVEEQVGLGRTTAVVECQCGTPGGYRAESNRRKPRHTTHHQHLPEKVTIVRVQHPFEGRSLNVLGVTHRKGRLHLVLILPDGSKSLIPAVWTDLALPIQLGSPPSTPTLGSLEDLLHARAVVDALLGRLAPATREDGNCPAKKESALARKKPKPVGSSARRNRRLGNRARGTPSSSHPDPGAADRPGCSTKPRFCQKFYENSDNGK